MALHLPVGLSRPTLTTLLLAAGGPAAIGAVLGMPRGGLAMASGAAMLPAILLGVTSLMLPALYITTSLLGAAPPAGETPAMLGRALRATGTVLLGMAAPSAFLAATMGSASTALALGALVTMGGALVGLRSLFAGMFSGRPVGALGVFVCVAWSLVALTIGGRLFFDTLAGVS